MLTNVGDRITRLELQFLKRLFIIFIAIELYHGKIVVDSYLDEDLFPKPFLIFIRNKKGKVADKKAEQLILDIRTKLTSDW